MSIYVLQVITGDEIGIRDVIIQLGYSAYAPRENRLIRACGEWKREEYLLFPSYVFIGCELTDELYYKIKAISGVIRFLGVAAPEPISNDEAVQIGILAPSSKALEPSVIEFDEHGTPRVVAGILTQLPPVKINRHTRRALVVLKHQGAPKHYSFSFVTRNTHKI